jgi:hypothetical protein
MPASASIEVPPVPLCRPAATVGVYRYLPAGSPKYSHLPNVQVLGIRYREGADPGVARFRYVFDAAGPPTDPQSFQQVMGVGSDLPGVVRNDDRLVVFATNPDGTPIALFDGFAQVPEMDLSPRREEVTFLAFGVAVREWDTPIGGALVRDADSPATISDVETDLETHFNPGGRPNATPAGASTKDGFGNQYPTFLDPNLIRSPDVRQSWSLPMAARYLCFRHNPDQSYVQNPDGAALDPLLVSLSPVSNAAFSPDDPTTFEVQPILVPDYPATGKVWPEALNDLLAPNGFGMAFRVGTDANGDPYTYLDVFQRQGSIDWTYKDLYLQPYGSAFDPASTNLGSARLARDISELANSITVESALVRYEATFVLAPGFAISQADAAGAGAIDAFDLGNAAPSGPAAAAYRLYVFDETGEGHWDFDSGSFIAAATPLNALLGDDDPNLTRPVKRRRVPIGELFTVDGSRRPLRAQLAISTNYQGKQPGVWDGTGTWQPVVGGFELLKDRLGIRINAPNPNGWHIGSSSASGAPYPSGIVHGVEDQANPGASHFALRLTCVIEGDSTVSATAGRRPTSPTSYTVTRHVDARDRYVKHVIAAESQFNPSGTPVVVRDDTPDAQADADARRAARESGEVAGSVTIPRFSNAYAIGDKVRSIQGRDLSLQTNAGMPMTEAPVYPAVVGLSWLFDGGQSTVLQLSDRRGEAR